MKRLLITSVLFLFTAGKSQPKKDDLAHVSGMMAIHHDNSGNYASTL